MFSSLCINRRLTQFCILVAAAALLVPVPGAEAASSGRNYPLCGLYCIYSIAKLEGREVDFRNLVKPEYLGSSKGSSLDELKQAAEDLGFSTLSLSRLTPDDLGGFTSPAILHVKSGYDQKEYNHFMLYLGIKNGRAEILNPPSELTRMPLADLAPLWDGNTLVVSSEALTIQNVTAASRKRLVSYAGLAVLGVASVHGFKRLISRSLSRPLRLGLSVGQAAGLVLISVFFGLLVHYLYGGGYFAQPSAVAGIQQAYAGSFIPKVSPSKMRTIVTRNHAVIVDSRLQRDYEAGHIENAVSLPVNCSDAAYQQVVSGLSKDRAIVLYCQSAGCPFAERIALRLKEDGFTNLTILEGGWMEWQKMQESQSTHIANREDDENV